VAPEDRLKGEGESRRDGDVDAKIGHHLHA
jgi:hypothetical protein